MTRPEAGADGLSRLPTPWLILAAAGLVAAVLFFDLPSRPRILAVLNDAAHAPVFGALALVLLVALRRAGMQDPWRSAGLAWLMTVVAGIVIESIQAQIGRDASWRDVYVDGLGALCALGLGMGWPALGLSDSSTTASPKGPRRAALALVAVSALLASYPVAEAIAAYALRWQRFPALAAFDAPLDLYFAQPVSARLQRVQLPHELTRPGDGVALRVESTGGRWPGWSHSEPAADFADYQTLHVEVANPGHVPLRLVVRVHDEAHDQRYEDRFNEPFSIAPVSRQVLSMPLAEVAEGPRDRKIDLERIAGIVVFAPDLPAGQQFYVIRVWLD